MTVPLRRCRVCRTQYPKPELTRWVRTDSGLVIDQSQKAPGRGYYSCSPKCAGILPRAIPASSAGRRKTSR